MLNHGLLLPGWSLFAFLVLLLGVTGECLADEIRLRWDAVDDERVALYQVHFGISRGVHTDWVNTDETSVVISQLAAGQVYFFAVRACVESALSCSGFSNEVGTRIPRTDLIGVYHPSMSGGTFWLDVTGNDTWDNGDWISGGFGSADALPIVGDWNGDGFDEIGVYYPNSGWWYLDNNDDGIWTDGTDRAFGFGGGTDSLPVAGDWNGDGFDEIGVYYPGEGWWYLDNNDDGIWTDGTDRAFGFGGGTDSLPVAGDWNGDGFDEIGIYYPSSGWWYLDGNGDGHWDSVEDTSALFGSMGDRPTAGHWAP